MPSPDNVSNDGNAETGECARLCAYLRVQFERVIRLCVCSKMTRCSPIFASLLQRRSFNCKCAARRANYFVNRFRGRYRFRNAVHSESTAQNVDVLRVSGTHLMTRIVCCFGRNLCLNFVGLASELGIICRCRMPVDAKIDTIVGRFVSEMQNKRISNIPMFRIIAYSTLKFNCIPVAPFFLSVDIKSN